tara:strand:+ start:379 stop:753 length:375 start_codon:yes stop_codon:yes gene_type:complete
MDGIKSQIKSLELIKFALAFFSLIIITILSIIINKNQEKVLKFVTNKYFLLSFFIILIFSYYVFFVLYEDEKDGSTKNIKKKRVKIATKHALLGYVIAIFTQIDSIILAPFLLVWIMSYFLDVE